MNLLHIGFKNYIPLTQIIGILDLGTGTVPISRMVAAAKQMSTCYDITKNKKVKSVIVCTGGILFLSPISSTILSQRINLITNRGNQI
jgi:regulator of extracellular matrix RemA (YlzA/DUF370 family)